MKEIGEEYDRLRENSRAGGWADLQRIIMRSMHILVPETTSFKEIVSIALDIESFLKTEQGAQSMHPMEALENWLNAAPAPPPATDEDSDDDSDSNDPETVN